MINDEEKLVEGFVEDKGAVRRNLAPVQPILFP